MGNEPTLVELEEQHEVLRKKCLDHEGDIRIDATQEEIDRLHELTDQIEFLRQSQKAKTEATHFDITGREVQVGDVYLTVEKSVQVIVSKGSSDMFLFSKLPAVGDVSGSTWDSLKAKAKVISAAVCAHNVKTGNWTFVKNIESKW